MIFLVSHILGFLVLAMQIALVGGIVCALFFRKRHSSRIFSKVAENGLFLAFIVALVATSGSLFYSQIAKFVPCQLCWFQRIFMYPQVLLIGLALIKKDRGIIDYCLSLSVVGALISLYHSYIFYGGVAVTTCGIANAASSCTQQFVVELGYITIPLMALTAFLAINFFLIVQKVKENSSKA